MAGIKDLRHPDHSHSEQAISCGFSGMQQTPMTYFDISISEEGMPQNIRLIVPIDPQSGQVTVLKVIEFFSVIERS